ncbi:MAG: PilN domain-containing protein [Planctomycetota bacterium]|jgi:Tfp pilus assembly protein PilN
MKAAKRKQRERFVTIGLNEHELTMLVLDRAADGTDARVRHRHLEWRQHNETLVSEAGREALVAVLSKLVAEEKLQGVPIVVSLSNDYCVTRVVSGDKDQVRQEVRELTARSSGYISLGVGEKLTAISEAPIDARQKRVWVTVANENVLNALDDIFSAAKLKIDRIEHSLAALCRVVNHTADDEDAPVILIDLVDSSVDVGISYRGQLLLDYRPSGAQARESIGVIVSRHTKRLQRYINRLLRTDAKVARLYLCGDNEEIARLCEQFDGLCGKDEIELRVLDPSLLAADWQLEEEALHDSSLTAGLGTLLEQTGSTTANDYPNLLDPLRDQRQKPVLKSLLKFGWPMLVPMAAALLLSLTTSGEKYLSDELESNLVNLEEDVAEVEHIEMEARAARTTLTHLEDIAKHAGIAPWQKLLNRVGQSMPRGVWMESFAVDAHGGITISGTSMTEDGIFDFLRHLRDVPQVWNVALESTRSTSVSRGPAVTFSVHASTGEEELVEADGLPHSWRTSQAGKETGPHRIAWQNLYFTDDHNAR